MRLPSHSTSDVCCNCCRNDTTSEPCPRSRNSRTLKLHRQGPAIQIPLYLSSYPEACYENALHFGLKTSTYYSSTGFYDSCIRLFDTPGHDTVLNAELLVLFGNDLYLRKLVVTYRPHVKYCFYRGLLVGLRRKSNLNNLQNI